MKKKLFCSLLALLCLYSQSLFAYVSTGDSRMSCISISNPRIDTPRSVIAYPLLFLKGQNGIEKDEKKALELLLEIQTYDSSKIWIAYCYEYGIGCEKDLEKADFFLSEIKSNNNLFLYTKDFLDKDYNSLFALKLANLHYERTKNYKNAYSTILNDENFKKDYPSEYNAILIEGEKKEAELISFLIPIYRENGDFEKAVALLDYLEDPTTLDYILKTEHNLKYAIRKLFFDIINIGDTALVEKLLRKKFSKKIFEDSDDANFSFAFCLRYGIGIEKDEKTADLLIENCLKAKMQDRFYKGSEQNLCSNVKNFKKSKFKEANDYIFYVAKKAAELGNFWLLAQAYEEGLGCKEDYGKALSRYDKIVQSDESKHYALDCVLRCFKKIREIENPSKELNDKVFISLLKNPKNLSFDPIILFYALMQKSPCTQDNKERAFKDLEDNLKNRQKNKYNSTSIYFEIKAYCYQNGIGCEKDLEKAEQTRREMWDFLDDFVKTENGKESIYKMLRGIYTPNISEIYKIYSPEIYDFYEQKIQDLEDERINAKTEKMLQDFVKESSEKLSEQEIDLFFEFYEISKLFKNKNTLAKGEEELAKFYDKLLKNDSEITALIISYTIDKAPYYRVKTRLDLTSLKLRVSSLALWEKLAESGYTKFYKHAAHCYEQGRGARIDKKLAAEYYSKAGIFFFAGRCYLAINDYDNALLSYKKADSTFYIYSDIYLSDTKHRDLKKANEYFLEYLGRKENMYHCIAASDVLEAKYYNFLLHDRTYKAIDLDDGKSYSAVMDFIEDFVDGFYCEKDLDKAIEIASKNRTPHILLYFLCDIEDSTPALFWEALGKSEEFWDKKFNSQNDDSFSAFKLLAMEKSYGCERDESKMDSLIKNMPNYRLNWIISKRDKFELSQNLLQKLYEKLHRTPNNDAKNFAMLCYLLGKSNEAKKVINTYHENGYTKFNASKLIDLYMHTRPLEEIALDFSLAKNPALKLAYATMLYRGQGCVADKEKAKEIFEQTASRWEDDNLGLSANIWLWIYYTEKGDTQKAKTFIDPESGFANLYTYKAALPMLAKMFKDNTYIPDLTKVYNLPKNNEYANYFLSLMKNEYFSTYAQDLMELFGQCTLFKNLEKKLEIRAKAKAKIEELKSL